MPSEFDLIQRFFTRPNRRADVVLSVGDDCALLQPRCDQLLAVTTDTLHAGIHFPHGTAAYDIGWKSLAVNLSDLAAMAAEPAWATLALSLPTDDERWLQGFADGMFALADQHGVALVGGDTTRGPLSITMTLHGFVPVTQALRRDGAQGGDIIAVTGTLGDAGRALQHVLATAAIDSPEDAEFLLARLNRPTPRISTALALRALAHAAIDLSDGLLQDLGHVVRRSGVAARVSVEQLPISAPLTRQCGTEAQAIELALNSGDDYELCLCIPPAQWPAAQAAAVASGVALTAIGDIRAGSPAVDLYWHDKPYSVARTGYDHFGAAP